MFLCLSVVYSFGMESPWQSTVEDFLHNLEEKGSFYSVIELCRFLLSSAESDTEAYVWTDKEEVLAYLKDYVEVSRMHQSFHERWSHLPNMKQLAEYDKKEAEKLLELCSQLEA